MNFPTFLVLMSILICDSVNSLSIFKNISVPSDVLSQLFLNEIRLNLDKISDPGPDYGPYNSEKCIFSLREIVKRYPSYEVAPFFDAWGNIPAGISSANEYDLGNYDQCIKTPLRIPELASPLRQQYCFANLPSKKDYLGLGPIASWNFADSLNIGICVPNTCSPELITAYFKSATKTAYQGVLSEISVERCTDGSVGPLTTANIVGISILGILTLLMILSTIYELYIDYYQKKPNPILISFSIFTNGKRLFAISTKKSRNSIDCLSGLRTISTFWIMNHHSYTIILRSAVINNLDFAAWFFSWEFMPIYNASISVDTFFFMGGLLVAWIGFKELDKTNGKINPIMNIVHRYFRLTPVLAAGLVLAYSVHQFAYTGPMKDIFMKLNNCDSTNWWPVLLYVQNYIFRNFNQCYDEAWYLSIDFQLYALSPLVLIPMWKWGRKFVPVLLVLMFLSLGCVLGVYFTEHYTGLLLGANTLEWGRVYTATHTRYAPWLIGFAFGYFMHKNRQKEFKLSKTVQILGWIGSFVVMTAVVFGPYFSLNANGTGSASTVFEAAIYESLKRVSWALTQVWITFACHYGYGGFVDAFLSHPYWQPLARLSYALYMMHMAVLRMNYGRQRTEIYYSVYDQYLVFCSALGVTFFIAVYVTLAFESPILNLERIIFNREKSKPKDNVGTGPSQGTIPNIVVAEPPATVGEQKDS